MFSIKICVSNIYKNTFKTYLKVHWIYNFVSPFWLNIRTQSHFHVILKLIKISTCCLIILLYHDLPVSLFLEIRLLICSIHWTFLYINFIHTLGYFLRLVLGMSIFKALGISCQSAFHFHWRDTQWLLMESEKLSARIYHSCRRGW